MLYNFSSIVKDTSMLFSILSILLSEKINLILSMKLSYSVIS